MRSLVIASGIVCVAASLCAGQGLEHAKLLPMGGQRGTASMVVVQGNNDPWPPKLWSRHPGIVGTPQETKGQMSIAIAAEVPLGMAFLRVADSQSASGLLPFVVSDVPVVSEVEPNDTYHQPQHVAGPAWVFDGVLGKSGDIDHIGVAMRQGERWWFRVDAHRGLRSPMDGNLQLLDARGNILAQNLDRFGLDPAIAWTCPRDGVYAVRVFAFPETPDSTIGYAGGDAFRYRLYGAQGTSAEWEDLLSDAAALVEPNDRAAPLPLGPIQGGSKLAISGFFESKDDQDAIAIETLEPGHWSVAAKALELGSDADVVLEILDAAGKSLASQGESGEIRDPVLKDQMKTPGKYTIVVRDLHRAYGDAVRYRIELEDERAHVTGTTAKDVLVAEVGKPLEVEIAVERSYDCGDEATLRFEGLPDTVSSEPAVSRTGDESATKVVVRLVASQPCSIPLQLRIEQSGRSDPRWVTSGLYRQPYLWLIAKPAP